jgi:hypothetical protein
MPADTPKQEPPAPRGSWLKAAIPFMRLVDTVSTPPVRRQVSWLSLVRTARAPLAVLSLAALGLLVPSQTDDMLATLSDGGRAAYIATFCFQLSLAALSVSAWYWARAVIDARFDVRGNRDERSRLAAEDTRIDLFALNAVPWLIVGLSALLGLCLIPRDQVLLNVALLAAWLAAFAFLAHASFEHPRAKSAPKTASPDSASATEALRRIGEALQPAAAYAQHFSKPGDSVVTRLQNWLWRLGARMRNWLRRLPRRVRERWRLLIRRAPGPRWVPLAMIGGALLVFLLGAIVSFMPSSWASALALPSRIARIFPGPAAALICLGLTIPLLSVVTFIADDFKFSIRVMKRDFGFARPPIILILAVWIVAMTYIFSLHTVRVAPSNLVGQRETLARFFTTWADACAPKDAAAVRPIIVAVSGGASRAAVWGASVLEKVEAATPTGRGPTVFAVSSVSGGSLGVAAYMATLRNLPADQLCRQGPTDGRKAQAAALDKVPLGHDALGPLIAAAVAVDLPRALLAPFAALVRTVSGREPRGGDRAEAIELAFEAIWKTAAPKRDGVFFDQAFLSLFYDGPGKIRPGMPIWIANGTETGTGGRLLTVPFAPDPAVWPFRAARDVLATLNADVPISTAINNTARFPYLEPSGQLLPVAPTTPVAGNPEIIDGGYFENEGLQTALELAEWLRTAGPALAGNRRVDPIIVQATGDGEAKSVLNDVVRCDDRQFDDPRDRSPAKPALQLLAPILGLYNVRGGHSAVVLRTAKLQYCPDSFFHFFLPGEKTGPGPNDRKDIPLNWVLSDRATNFIRKAIGDKDIGNEDESTKLQKALARE